MKIYDLKNKDGEIYAFEIQNIGRRKVSKIVKKIPGSIVKKFPSLFSWIKGQDEFCEFEVDGCTFVIEEPFGDNSRYWIGPKNTSFLCPQLVKVRETFLSD